MILPIKTKNPPESPPNATFALIGINILVYVFTSNGLEVREEVVHQFALTHANVGPVTLLSSMFLHGNILHILGNMWFLWLLGAAVEGRLKTIKFLLLYMVAGLTGSALHLVMTAHEKDLPSLGASGAIMGLMGAALWMFPFSKMKVWYFFSLWWYGVWEWRMWGVALYYLGFDIFDAVLSGSDGVAHFAHIGGAAGGFLVALFLRAKRDDPVVSDAKSELSDSSDLRALSKTELSQLAAAQPDSPEFALAWMARSVEYAGQPTPDCTRHFLTHVRKLVREGDIDQLGTALFTLSETSGQVPPEVLYDAGIRLEREGRPQLALPLLERALTDPQCPDSVAEGIVFKLGMMQEAWFQNHTKALDLFKEHQQRWPFSPMEPQVKERISVLTARA